MEEKKSFGEWCKDSWNRHKRKIIIASGVVLVAAGGYLLIKYSDEILEFFDGLCDGEDLQKLSDNVVEKAPVMMEEPSLEVVRETREVPVRCHLMRLPEGKHASEAAKVYAEEHGMTLIEGVTVRRDSIRKIAA